MRLVSWNINGLKSLLSKHNDLSKLFAELDADVICFQVRSASVRAGFSMCNVLSSKICITVYVIIRNQESRFAEADITFHHIPDGYDAFINACRRNSGYSGVMTYVKQSLLPLRTVASFAQ